MQALQSKAFVAGKAVQVQSRTTGKPVRCPVVVRAQKEEVRTEPPRVVAPCDAPGLASPQSSCPSIDAGGLEIGARFAGAEG